MKRFAPPDAMAFLLMESARRPLHMGGLQLFAPPAGAGSDFVRNTYAAMRACTDVAPMFAGHPTVTKRGRSFIMRWTYDNDVDLDYHFRYTSLPAPGGKDELFELISHIHGRSLDRGRPLWEVHMIDGLADGRFAILTKIHHALCDGVSFMSLLRRSLTTDPHTDQVRVLWSLRPEPGTQSRDAEPSAPREDGFTGKAKSLGELGRSVPMIGAALRERELFPVFRAPPTIFNVNSDVPWIFATHHFPMHRIQDIRQAAGATINDMALAMCAGALRSYLAERNALPDRPLVAAVPVDLRTAEDVEGRNVMSSAACNLGTHLEDPVKRLATIHASMNYNKQLLRGLPRQVSIYLAGVVGAPFTDDSRLGRLLAPQFNVGISHVVGVDETQYLNGARLDETYGFPPTLAGHAFNVGIVSTADGLNFGIVACARVVPDLDPFLEYLETSLKDLERAVGR